MHENSIALNRKTLFHETLAIIPARGGSKGIPRKNVRALNGKPLVAHTIEQALATPAISRVVVSTDDAEIGAVAQQYGAEVVWRPAEISGDTASSESALLHVLDHLAQTEGYEPELVVFLQCTSPLRRENDIGQAVQRLLEEQADSLLSLTRFAHFLWHVPAGRLTSLNFDHTHRPRSQELAPLYMENGSIYVLKPWVLHQFGNRLGGKIAYYEMDPLSAVDIDTLADFALCEAIMVSAWGITDND
ncbi:MAG: acylneuraminate cytidylyltransferase family protein [Anaerolineae bacterium]|nr:acylneuraminate cytidylyltransferase family protein [Anaerolineae bacterium]